MGKQKSRTLLVCAVFLFAQVSSGAWIPPLLDRKAALNLGFASAISLLSRTEKLSGAKPVEPKAPLKIAYGKDKDQFGELWLPADIQDTSLPVVTLIHGGFWQQEYDLRLMDRLASSVAAQGCACWNIEYRRVGSTSWGNPDTFSDVSSALAWVGSDAGRDLRLDANRLVVAGHSAGGTLAMWAALASLLSPTCSGSISAAATPKAAVSLGGVVDLAWAERERQGGAAVDQLLGGPPPYLCSSPIDMLPPVSESLRRQAGRGLQQPDCLLGLVHAEADRIVPVAQSIRFTVAACTAGFEVELHRVRGESHFSCLDPQSASWQAALSLLTRGLEGDVPHFTSSSQEMLPTLREETATSVIIRTRRARR